jgi:hypothetical protein
VFVLTPGTTNFGSIDVGHSHVRAIEHERVAVDNAAIPISCTYLKPACLNVRSWWHGIARNFYPREIAAVAKHNRQYKHGSQRDCSKGPPVSRSHPLSLSISMERFECSMQVR